MARRAESQFDPRRLTDWRAVSIELARRAAARDGTSQVYHDASYVVRVSDPITLLEKLQLLAARMQRTSIAIMPHPCRTADEWMRRYGKP